MTTLEDVLYNGFDHYDALIKNWTKFGNLSKQKTI